MLVKFKLMLNSTDTINVQRREFCLGAFCFYFCTQLSLYIALCSDTYELISFELGVMIDTLKPHCLVPVWMTLTFTQGHRIMRQLKHGMGIVRQLECLQSFCHCMAWRAQTFTMVGYVMGMTAKKSFTYCDYRSFEHFFFVYSIMDMLIIICFESCLKLI